MTVGTTKFDALIEAIDDLRVADALVTRGFDRLVMQVSLKPLLRYAPFQSVRITGTPCIYCE